MNRKLLIIELNEFNPDLLARGADELSLSNVRRVLDLERSRTMSPDREEHHGLDPWVQWVSIHTGAPRSEHRVKRLGEGPGLSHPQFWELLGRQGISTGIWGAMNASRKEAEHCRFFLPDPWMFSESAWPGALNRLLVLPRYYSKNYLAPSFTALAGGIVQAMCFFLVPSMMGCLLAETGRTLRILMRHGLRNHVLFCLFDVLSARVFLKYKRRYDPQVSLIFMNCLAHAQHHHWHQDEWNPELRLVLETVDHLFGLLLDAVEDDEALLVLNGFTQENVRGQGYCIYRQIDPGAFLRVLEIPFERVEQCMTNDGHVFFRDREQRDAAVEALRRVQLDGIALFHVETCDDEETRLFYQFDFFERVSVNETFEVGERTYAFHDHFALLAERTGSHIPEGVAFHRGISLAVEQANHDVGQAILRHYAVDRTTEEAA